jgi:hypothetical protein
MTTMIDAAIEALIRERVAEALDRYHDNILHKFEENLISNSPLHTKGPYEYLRENCAPNRINR